MRIVYQKASLGNISEIMDLIQAAVLNMEQHGIYQWDKLYPIEEDIVNDITKGELYIGQVEGIITVIYVIN